MDIRCAVCNVFPAIAGEPAASLKAGI